MEGQRTERSRWTWSMYVVVFFLCAMLLPPEGLSTINSRIYSLWYYGKYIAYFVIVLMAIATEFSYGRDHHFDYFSLLFFFGALGITIIEHGLIGAWFQNFGNAIFLLLMLSWLSDRIPEFLKTMNTYLVILSILNLLCMLKWPNGMYVTEKTRYTQNWLFGYKSSFQYYLFPCIFISWLEHEYRWMSTGSYVLILGLCFYQAYAAGNVMLLIAIILIMLVSLFNLTKITLLFNSNVYFVIILLANTLMIFFTTALVSSSFGRAFLIYFNKQATLGGRTTAIWPVALRYIRQSPLLGYGVLTSDRHRDLYGMPAAIHAHNQFLELLFTGGIVLLVVFLLWLFLKLKKVDDRSMHSSRVIGFSILMALLMVTVEVFTRGIGVGFWLILYLTNYTEEIDWQYRIDENQSDLPELQIPDVGGLGGPLGE